VQVTLHACHPCPLLDQLPVSLLQLRCQHSLLLLQLLAALPVPAACLHLRLQLAAVLLQLLHSLLEGQDVLLVLEGRLCVWRGLRCRSLLLLELLL
jgi:hypothetical protein